MTIDDIMALAHTCCILYSARGEHEGVVWEELRVAIEQALEAATAAERERCAKLFDTTLNGEAEHYWREAAAAIRNQK